MYEAQAHSEELFSSAPQIRSGEQPGRGNKSEDTKSFSTKPAGHK